MRVTYQNPISGFRGKHGGLVYYYHPGLKRRIAREYVMPRLTENNRRLGAVTRRLRSLGIAEGYRDDLRVYLRLQDSHAATEGWCRGIYWLLFNKLMWSPALQRDLDLEFVTREQLAGLPCATVKDAVEAGLLPRVPGYELLKHPIWTD